MNKKLMGWLIDRNVASFSPHVGMLLLRIVGDLRKELKADKNIDPDVKLDIEKYIADLLSVAQTGGDHQGAVLAKLSSLLGNPPPGWTKERV